MGIFLRKYREFTFIKVNIKILKQNFPIKIEREPSDFLEVLRALLFDILQSVPGTVLGKNG